jgi:hypothetical protein
VGAWIQDSTDSDEETNHTEKNNHTLRLDKCPRFEDIERLIMYRHAVGTSVAEDEDNLDDYLQCVLEITLRETDVGAKVTCGSGWQMRDTISAVAAQEKLPNPAPEETRKRVEELVQPAVDKLKGALRAEPRFTEEMITVLAKEVGEAW